ncbi:MAG TPA: helix-turn-helix domain-containing protein [Coleofasciculaceae cyanobacterium]|jgi:hypothetical protein
MSLRDFGRRELTLLRLYIDCQLAMSPQDFYAKYNVSHSTIAKIAGCSVPTVDRWFSTGRSRRAPSPIHLRRLAEMDILLESFEQIPAPLRQRLCPPQHLDNQNLSP